MLAALLPPVSTMDVPRQAVAVATRLQTEIAGFAVVSSEVRPATAATLSSPYDFRKSIRLSQDIFAYRPSLSRMSAIGSSCEKRSGLREIREAGMSDPSRIARLYPNR